MDDLDPCDFFLNLSQIPTEEELQFEDDLAPIFPSSVSAMANIANDNIEQLAGELEKEKEKEEICLMTSQPIIQLTPSLPPPSSLKKPLDVHKTSFGDYLDEVDGPPHGSKSWNALLAQNKLSKREREEEEKQSRMFDFVKDSNPQDYLTTKGKKRKRDTDFVPTNTLICEGSNEEEEVQRAVQKMKKQKKRKKFVLKEDKRTEALKDFQKKMNAVSILGNCDLKKKGYNFVDRRRNCKDVGLQVINSYGSSIFKDGEMHCFDCVQNYFLKHHSDVRKRYRLLINTYVGMPILYADEYIERCKEDGVDVQSYCLLFNCGRQNEGFANIMNKLTLMKVYGFPDIIRYAFQNFGMD